MAVGTETLTESDLFEVEVLPLELDDVFDLLLLVLVTHQAGVRVRYAGQFLLRGPLLVEEGAPFRRKVVQLLLQRGRRGRKGT